MLVFRGSTVPVKRIISVPDFSRVCLNFGFDIFKSNWKVCFFLGTPRKTNMTMENPPFEDVFPIENVEFPMSS